MRCLSSSSVVFYRNLTRWILRLPFSRRRAAETLKSVKEDLQADIILMTTKVRDHQSLNNLLQVNIPWLAVALNRAPQETGHATRLLAALSRSSFGSAECNLCGVPYCPQSYFQHLAACHLFTNFEQLMAELSASADFIFETGRKLLKL